MTTQEIDALMAKWKQIDDLMYNAYIDGLPVSLSLIKDVLSHLAVLMAAVDALDNDTDRRYYEYECYYLINHFGLLLHKVGSRYAPR